MKTFKLVNQKIEYTNHQYPKVKLTEMLSLK